jgi:tetrathionate reductase subunit A
MMKITRRDFVKGLGAAGALGIFAAGSASTLKAVSNGWWAGEKPTNLLAGNALLPECSVDLKTGKVTANPDQYLANGLCTGCTTLCGIRARVDRRSNRVLRVGGNPYHPLSTAPALPYETGISDSFKALSRFQENGLVQRSVVCSRGNAALDMLADPKRVLTPLKRVGPRGRGQWQPISYEQLIKEVIEGGNLFGEGQVDGLRAIRDTKTPIDPQAPELGPRSNQLAMVTGYKNGRLSFAKRFGVLSFGSKNFTGHRGNCGLSMRGGYAALLGDWEKYPHLKPDYAYCEYYLSIATAPGNAGNPFKRQAMLLAEARTTGQMKYVIVDPVQTNSNTLTVGSRSEWLPITPGTDGALVMGMIRWIIENERYNTRFLSCPNGDQAELAGEPSWSNATHLVVTDAGSPLSGTFLRAAAIGIGSAESMVVIDRESGKPVAQDRANGPAVLLYSGNVTIDGQQLGVKTSLQILFDEARKQTLEDYSAACGVPVETIVRLAREFTSHGRRAVADTHGGTMHSNGFYTAYAIVMLNALIGNLNWKGGMSSGGGSYSDVKPGPRYNMVEFPGKVKLKGVPVSRHGFPYEKTSEFKRKKEVGQPYPADGPWFPLATGLQPEFVLGGLNSYPYPLKALIFWNTNPVYGQSGLSGQLDKLRDPKRIPLMICIDSFMSETAAECDYIVPDTSLYENFASATPWSGTLTKISTISWPSVCAPQQTTPSGDPICMESFLIDIAKQMKLPGFGDRAIPDVDGKLGPLHRPQDWYLRLFANIAFDGKAVPDATDEDIFMSGLDCFTSSLAAVLKPEERRKVAYVMSRGGRFESEKNSYQGEWLSYRYKKPLQLYNETLARQHNSMTGERFLGTPRWIPPVSIDGCPLSDNYPASKWPFRLVSTKSQFMNSGTIAAKRLRELRPSNELAMHVEDARRLGIRNGDRVRLVTAGGEAEGVVSVRKGLMPGVIGIEHGFGHWHFGADAMQLGNRKISADPAYGAGVAMNRLGLSDPVRPGISTLADFVLGANARNGLPARVEKV